MLFKGIKFDVALAGEPAEGAVRRLSRFVIYGEI